MIVCNLNIPIVQCWVSFRLPNNEQKEYQPEKLSLDGQFHLFVRWKQRYPRITRVAFLPHHILFVVWLQWSHSTIPHESFLRAIIANRLEGASDSTANSEESGRYASLLCLCCCLFFLALEFSKTTLVVNVRLVKYWLWKTWNLTSTTTD